MDKVLFEKIYTAAAGIVVSLITGVVMRKGWKMVTGAAPPNMDDPGVPTKKALAWFALSTLGAGLATLLVRRSAARFAIASVEARAAS